jgi:Peptidase family M28
VAAVISAADELTANPPENLDVWVVLAGAEESFCEGSRAFVKGRRKEFDRATTAFVNVDSVSFGQVAYEISQGPVNSLPHDPQLIELCEALSAAGQSARPIRHPLLDDAMPARVRRLRAITLRTTDEQGSLAPWYHTHEDVPERVDSEALTRATDFVVSLACLLDREAGRSPAQSQATGPPPAPLTDFFSAV